MAARESRHPPCALPSLHILTHPLASLIVLIVVALHCPALLLLRTSPGWNPVTGLGTPNWTVLRDYVLAVGSKEYKRTLFD